jgi:hypothetical protein
MKTLRNLLIIVIGAIALTAVPIKSHAGILSDILNSLFGKDNKGWHKPPPPPPPPPGGTDCPPGPTAGGGGNSVPLGAGIIFLVAGGFGLGAKLLTSRQTVE